MEYSTWYIQKLTSTLIKSFEVTDDTLSKGLEEIEKISKHILGISLRHDVIVWDIWTFKKIW
jgi:hypothetical protein